MNQEYTDKRARLLKGKGLKIVKIEQSRVCNLCGGLTRIALIHNKAMEYYCQNCIYVRANNIF